MTSNAPVPPARNAGGTLETAEAEQSAWLPADGTRLILYSFFLAVGGLYLFLALQLPMESRRGVGPALFPIIAVTIFLACVGIDLIRLFVKYRRGHWEHGTGRLSWRVLAVIGIIIAYLALVNVLGHLLTAALITAALVLIFGRRPWWQVLLAAAIAGFGTDYLFSEVFGLNLPTGIFEIGVTSWI